LFESNKEEKELRQGQKRCDSVCMPVKSRSFSSGECRHLVQSSCEKRKEKAKDETRRWKEKANDAWRASRTADAEREFFIDNLLVRIHFIIKMIWWTGLAPWE